MAAASRANSWLMSCSNLASSSRGDGQPPVSVLHGRVSRTTLEMGGFRQGPVMTARRRRGMLPLAATAGSPGQHDDSPQQQQQQREQIQQQQQREQRHEESATSTALSAARGRSQPPVGAGSAISGLLDYWDPFNFGTRSFRQIMDTMDRLFDTPSVISLQDTVARPYLRSPWDIVEEEDSYHMRIDLPGFNKDEVKVQLEENVFLVDAEHRAEHKDKWRSRTHGKYHTRIALPDTVDTSKVSAKLDNGVLDVSIPKLKKEKKVLDVKVN